MGSLNTLCREKSDVEEDGRRKHIYSTILKKEHLTRSSKLCARKTGKMFTQRLSVSELLERVESQSKLIASMFPLMQKPTLKTQLSSDSDVDDFISPLTCSCGPLMEETNEEEEEGQTLKTYNDADTKCLSIIDNNLMGDAMLTTTNSLTPPKDFWSHHSNVCFGVNIEYLIFESTLKVSVGKFEKKQSNLYHKKEFAKICVVKQEIREGNMKRKVKVTSGKGVWQTQSAQFRGIDGKYIHSVVAEISIFAKRGLFKKDKSLVHLSVPLQEIDLVESQTIWKYI